MAVLNSAIMKKQIFRFAFIAFATTLLIPGGAFAQDVSDLPLDQQYVVYSHPDDLPEVVRAKRQALLDAARTGDVEYFASIIEEQEFPPTLTFGEMPNGPVEYLRESSPDGEGPALLARMVNLLEAPYAVMGPETDDPIYIWPYHAAMPDVTALTLDQKLDAFVVGGDDAMKSIEEAGAYYGYRLIIGKDGNWNSFVRGD